MPKKGKEKLIVKADYRTDERSEEGGAKRSVATKRQLSSGKICKKKIFAEHRPGVDCEGTPETGRKRVIFTKRGT